MSLRFLWLIVVVVSVFLLYNFAHRTIEEYIKSPIKIQVTSTNTPAEFEDFPVITLCPNNLISFNKLKSAGITMSNITTMEDYKEVIFELANNYF